MTSPSDIIAWLVPTARGSWADKAAHLSDNATRAVRVSKSQNLSSKIPDLLPGSKPAKAIQLSFAKATKRHGSFIIGTDPRTCDVVLPKVDRVASQHCALTFDGQSRLTLTDFSETGTQVWYDWECTGDKTDYSWILSSPPSSDEFPSQVQRITIDIQGVRFQVVINDHSDDWEAYKAKVDAFCEPPAWETSLASSLEESAASGYASYLTSDPFHHVVVKNMESGHAGDVYLWNLSKPWEPMVKAAA